MSVEQVILDVPLVPNKKPRKPRRTKLQMIEYKKEQENKPPEEKKKRGRKPKPKDIEPKEIKPPMKKGAIPRQTDTEKECKICKKLKPLNKFYKAQTTKLSPSTLYQASCKYCFRIQKMKNVAKKQGYKTFEDYLKFRGFDNYDEYLQDFLKKNNVKTFDEYIDRMPGEKKNHK